MRAGPGSEQGAAPGGGGEDPSSTAPPAARPVREPQVPALALRTVPVQTRVCAAAANLSIQEEQGAPGTASANCNSQEALRRRRRSDLRGPIGTKGRARASGPGGGDAEGALRTDWLEGRRRDFGGCARDRLARGSQDPCRARVPAAVMEGTSGGFRKVSAPAEQGAGTGRGTPGWLTCGPRAAPATPAGALWGQARSQNPTATPAPRALGSPRAGSCSRVA